MALLTVGNAEILVDSEQREENSDAPVLEVANPAHALQSTTKD